MLEAGWDNMRNLLKFHYRRLFLRSSLYICMGIIAVPLILIFFIISSYLFSSVKLSMNTVFSTMMSMANLSTLVIVFTSIFCCEDYSKGTAKTLYSAGYPRYLLFLSKFIVSTTAAAMMFGIVLIFSLLCGLIYGASWDTSDSLYSTFSSILGNTPKNEPDFVMTVLQQLFVIIGAHACYFMVAELLGKTGFTIVLCIFGPGVISTAFMIITNICSIIFPGVNSSEAADIASTIYMYFTAYWLPSGLGSLYNLIGGSITVPWISIVVNTFYVLLFGGFALLITNKKQIK